MNDYNNYDPRALIKNSNNVSSPKEVPISPQLQIDYANQIEQVRIKPPLENGR